MSERKSHAAIFRVAGLYLPTISLGYLYLLAGTVSHLAVAAVSLLGAMLVHGFLRSVFGPGLAERSSVDAAEFVQRLQLVLYNRGALSDFPSSWRALHRADRSFPKRRLPLVAVTVGSGLALGVGLGLSLFELWFQFVTGTPIAGLLFLGQAVWILQPILWSGWPSVHSSLDYQTGIELGIERDIGEFRRFLELNEDIHGPSLSYESNTGGAVFLQYRTDCRTKEEMRSEVETVAYGYAATVAQSNYPCGGVAVTLLGSDGPIGNYHIETTHANKYTDRKLPVQKYVNQIMETVDLEPEEGDANAVTENGQPTSSREIGPPEPSVRSGQTNG